jgi:hypothetical protein
MTQRAQSARCVMRFERRSEAERGEVMVPSHMTIATRERFPITE